MDGNAVQVYVRASRMTHFAIGSIVGYVLPGKPVDLIFQD
jgi:hypothetical protein